MFCPSCFATFILVLGDESSSFAQDNVMTIYDTGPWGNFYMSRDGQVVVLAYDDHLEAWNIIMGEKVAETTEALFVDIPLAYSRIGQPIAWTADGLYAAAVDTEENTISVYESGNNIPLYTVAGDESEEYWLEAVLWRSDGAIWTPIDRVQEDIRFYDAEQGTIRGQIELDTEQYLYRVSFYGLQFEPDGHALAVGRVSGSRSSILVYDSNTLEEKVIVEEYWSSVGGAISFQWLGQDVLNYCIDPYIEGYANGLEDVSESVIHNLETGDMTYIPICVADASPDGRYGVQKNIDAEIQVIDLTTGDMVDVLALTDFSDTDPFTLFEAIRVSWNVGGIIIHRGIPLTIWQPKLP
jgi:hypothetical protein